MFHHRSDPGALGIGVAFTSAALDLGDRQDAEARAAAFAELSDALGVPIAVVHQVHGTAVAEADAPPGTRGLVDLAREADAVFTTQKGLGVAVRVADCLPILLAAEDASIVAAVHAGRAGLLAGVIGETVARLRSMTPAPLLGWIGPHVCGPCYEVPDAMAADAAARLDVPATTTRWGTAGIDLGAGAVRQLNDAGVTVTRLDPCTLESRDLHSHRRDHGAGRQIGVIWLASPRRGLASDGRAAPGAAVAAS